VGDVSVVADAVAAKAIAAAATTARRLRILTYLISSPCFEPSGLDFFSSSRRFVETPLVRKMSEVLPPMPSDAA